MAIVAVLGLNSYGKSAVRLMKVTRYPDRQDLKEVNVNIQMEGAFETVYTEGDNSNVLPTDTMKNTVYALASSHPLNSVEEFGQNLADHFITRNPDVTKVTIELEESLWERIPIGPNASAHPWSFSGGGSEKRTAVVTRTSQNVSIRSGIRDLLILKTKGSAFHGYVKDAFTTLKEAHDRILATKAEISWLYGTTGINFNESYQSVRQAILEAFSAHDSLSVQHTLYAMGEAALSACKEILEVSLTMPNKHCIPVDLTPFGLENKNEIFVPTSEPHGLISGTVKRT